MMSTCRSLADLTDSVQCGSGPAPPLRPLSCWPPPSWPAKPERNADLQSPGRANPHPDFWGAKRSEKNLRDYAHRNLVRAMGPECRCAVRNATATRVGGFMCVRCMECKAESCSPPLAAMLHEGVWHVMEKAEAHGGSLRVHGGHGTAEGCTTPHAWCTLPPVRRPGWTRGAFICSRCATRPMQATNGGGGKCAPCRRASLPAPASAKTWPFRRIGGGWGQAWH